ncbi:MAG: glycosyltransferase [Chloroflexi bacterium]|nr:glycosyltransferase [Chloroflexota bacterium]MBV9134346.1 glycosyltransferase [Chloroflexota bacterium]
MWTFAELPVPPQGRVGWPWMASDMPTRIGGLRVSIVTPSLNQAGFLEATLRSVLLQGYSNLEYFVLDGGSTDGSAELIARYAPFLDYYRSAPDGGQAHAINKGFRRASGDIVAWLNSDDYYTPGAIASAVAAFEADDSLDWVYGDCLQLNPSTGTLSNLNCEPFKLPQVLYGRNPIFQPGVFLRRRLIERLGGIDETFRLAMDYDLWLRAIKLSQPRYVASQRLAVVTDHADTKSRRQLGEVVFESTRAIERFYDEPGVSTDVVATRDAALAHLYFECAAACVLWRRSLTQAIPWYLRAVTHDPRLICRVPVVLAQTLATLASTHRRWFGRRSIGQA